MSGPSPAPRPAPPTPPRGFAGGLAEDVFARIAARIAARSGIVTSPRKSRRFAERLGVRLRALRLSGFEEYLAYLDGPDGEAEMAGLLNAVTTNVTAFFREPHHFEHLEREVLAPRAANGGRLRVWTGACATGEEAYSIALVARRALGPSAWRDFRILATDLDTAALETARAGIYAERDLAAIPTPLRDGFAGPDGTRAAQELRDAIAFRPLNLVQPWPMRGPFEAIFCRNVLIYFAPREAGAVVARLARLLAPGGVLYLGHSESLLGAAAGLEPAGRTIFRKPS